MIYCLLLCTLDLVFLIGNRVSWKNPGLSFQLVSSIWEEWRTFTSCMMFCHVYKLFVCHLLNIVVSLCIFFLFCLLYSNVCQSIEFDLKGSLGLRAPFRISFWVCILFHKSIPLPAFHASVCLGSRFLAVWWRHQSRIWNCSKSQALGRFVICYITYHCQ